MDCVPGGLLQSLLSNNNNQDLLDLFQPQRGTIVLSALPNETQSGSYQLTYGGEAQAPTMFWKTDGGQTGNYNYSGPTLVPRGSYIIATLYDKPTDRTLVVKMSST